jgi:hypothetical protein
MIAPAAACSREKKWLRLMIAARDSEDNSVSHDEFSSLAQNGIARK